MVEKQEYEIIITSSAEKAYFEVLDYAFEYHYLSRANEIALELLEFPQILKKFPLLGHKEFQLKHRPENYRFLLYDRTERLTVKIIYYADEEKKTIYLTDFFASERDENNINRK